MEEEDDDDNDVKDDVEDDVKDDDEDNVKEEDDDNYEEDDYVEDNDDNNNDANDDETVNDEDDNDIDNDIDEGDEEDDKQEEIKASLKSIMLKKVKSLKLGSSVVEIEFLKLINSSCINLISHTYAELYQDVIPFNTFQDIWRTCNTYKLQYQTSCESKIRELVYEIFDDLVQFQFE